MYDQDGKLVSLECYTLSEAAMALGKNHLTLKRWIANDFIPPPIYSDAVHNYPQYSYEEVDAMGRELRKHERLYEYLHKTHEKTINALWEAVENAR